MYNALLNMHKIIPENTLLYLITFVDEHSHDIPEENYIKCCNLLKKLYERSIYLRSQSKGKGIPSLYIPKAPGSKSIAKPTRSDLYRHHRYLGDKHRRLEDYAQKILRRVTNQDRVNVLTTFLRNHNIPVPKKQSYNKKRISQLWNIVRKEFSEPEVFADVKYMLLESMEDVADERYEKYMPYVENTIESLRFERLLCDKSEMINYTM